MKHFPISLALLLTFLVAGCSAVSPATSTPNQPAVIQPAATQPTASASADLSRTDEQGAVVIVVEPLNLETADQTLDFQVSMNTHMVDLSMDLTRLATLTTDKGITASAIVWDAPQGGHHVSGKLSFPASVNGTSVLDGATELTLTIRDVDAPERAFTWEFSK